MAYDINAALERLETNLAEVESAKKQVDETIATSESLQQIIGRYTATLNSMGKDGGVSKRRILFFYKQSPDFHKPGLCHVQKILYL